LSTNYQPPPILSLKASHRLQASTQAVPHLMMSGSANKLNRKGCTSSRVSGPPRFSSSTPTYSTAAASNTPCELISASEQPWEGAAGRQMSSKKKRKQMQRTVNAAHIRGAQSTCNWHALSFQARKGAHSSTETTLMHF